jgi:hypothetical protein
LKTREIPWCWKIPSSQRRLIEGATDRFIGERQILAPFGQDDVLRLFSTSLGNPNLIAWNHGEGERDGMKDANGDLCRDHKYMMNLQMARKNAA